MNSVLTEQHHETLIITLNRPQRRNAIDTATGIALRQAVLDFENDDNLRIAILTGNGDHFCAGADLKALGGPDIPWSPELGHAPLGPTWRSPGKPIIAAIEGYAVAGGLELALWCDLRVAARGATFGVYCRRWGVPLMDGGTVRLPRLIGHGRALDMILTGRGVGAEEALQIGLSNRISDPGAALETALQLARSIAKHPQRCMLLDRQSSYEQEGLARDAAIAQEAEQAWHYLQSGEFRDGVNRFNQGEGRHGS